MAGLLSDILGFVDRSKQAAKANLGLLYNDPKEYFSTVNDQAKQFNQAQALAAQASQNAYKGLPVTPEQAAARQYVDRVTENMAMGFAGSTKPLNNPLNTLERMTPWFVQYPKAGKVVDGLNVGKEVKNMGSIPASFEKYEIDKGIRSVSMSDFPGADVNKLFRSADDIKRTKDLAEQIKKNKYVDPLIVAIDEQGPYVLEGGHRLGALNLLGIKNFPAIVVRDLGY
jgi:hypothetical protein